MPNIKKSHLQNGITVITEEVPRTLSSSLGVWVRTGSRDESRASGGISHFIEHMLFKGTRKRSALDIAKEIEGVGGVLNAFTGREQTCFYAKVLNSDLPLAIDLLSDILINSRFDAKELERERQVILQEIRMVDDTPDDLVHDLFFERFWRGAPLGRPILGNMRTVSAFTRDDVVDYYRERYLPGSVLITAAGGLKHSKVVKALERSFGRLKGGTGAVAREAPSATPGAVILKKDLEQVHFCLGVPSLPQTDPRRYSLYLLNTILGGGMSSRLFQEVREKRGLAYSVYSYLTLLRDAGGLVVYAGTSKKEFPKVLKVVLSEFRKIRKGATRAELKAAKEQLKGSMLMGLESSDSRMTKLARDELYFGKRLTPRSMVKAIDAVRAADLVETAEELLVPRNVTMVAVGKVSKKDLPTAFKNVETL